ncbi:MAG: Flp pilus assembly complex ATPase component TadA [Planctomycetes bacterium]|nr:Flp pilus assembly complex ATPase component TadA [Planctomycetota bacterium]
MSIATPTPTRSPLQSRPRLGDLLVRRGFLSAERLQEALRLQKEGEQTKLLGELLVDREFCSEEQVLECLAVEFQLPFVRLEARLFDPKVVELLPRDFIEKHVVLPLFKVRDTLTVAVAEPSDVFLLDRLKSVARCEIQLAIASARDIRRTLQTYLPDSQVFVIDDIIDDVQGDAVELIEESIDDIVSVTELAGQSPIIRLVNYIIYTAVKEGASDIHIEPTERQIRVRFRVDGTLHKALELPGHIAPAVASRIKIMASLDISERRLPQDGRIHVMMEGRSIDLRVSTLPLTHGEKTVIRILDNRNIPLTLAQLGFSTENLERFQHNINRPNGIVLVTGPTGSGKSTTLYAALNTVSTIEKNICTVEDPVEFQLQLINQFQVNERVGLTFASVLRSLLRQDPDILMVGEIRDAETARIAIQSALTGHLVFSTLHTNDACSAVTRLVNMGVEGYLIGASLNAVLAQRLCRRICAKCKQAYEPSKATRLLVQQMGLDVQELYRGAGCARCRNTGFAGRIAIHELLVVDDNLREKINVSATLQSVTEHARRSGMIPLRYDGLRKAKEGLTTIEEVLQASDEGWVPTSIAPRS